MTGPADASRGEDAVGEAGLEFIVLLVLVWGEVKFCFFVDEGAEFGGCEGVLFELEVEEANGLGNGLEIGGKMGVPRRWGRGGPQGTGAPGPGRW